MTQECAENTKDLELTEGKSFPEGHEDKRSRIEETANSVEPVAMPTFQKAAPPPRCNQCRQLLDDPDLRLYPGDHCDAVCQCFLADVNAAHNMIGYWHDTVIWLYVCPSVWLYVCPSVCGAEHCGTVGVGC